MDQPEVQIVVVKLRLRLAAVGIGPTYSKLLDDLILGDVEVEIPLPKKLTARVVQHGTKTGPAKTPETRPRKAASKRPAKSTAP